MDQCDVKINLLNICGSVTFISWSIDLVIHLNNFYIFKNWCRLGVFVTLRAFALVFFISSPVGSEKEVIS